MTPARTTQLASTSTSSHPDRIGPFRVLAPIGEGAIGIVYEAEQERPRRRVALKIIRPGVAMPTMLRRFEHEYEFLGRLQHPGIAQTSVDRDIATQFFRVRLWDQDGLIDQILEHYDKLDDDLRAELPLKRTWTLVRMQKSEPFRPLKAAQVRAAAEICTLLPQREAAWSALRRLGQAMPGFSPHVCLLKVAALNDLLGTNLYATHRMAAHISAIFSRGRFKRSPDLVERIATMGMKGGHRHRSFASKFCHVFVDADAFPILDGWAAAALKHHCGRNGIWDPERRYTAFAANVTLLISQSRLRSTISEVDNYLWLRGGYEAWRRKPEKPMNSELKGVFTRLRHSTLLRRLRGDC